jgi:hypothetical protein
MKPIVIKIYSDNFFYCEKNISVYKKFNNLAFFYFNSLSLSYNFEPYYNFINEFRIYMDKTVFNLLLRIIYSNKKYLKSDNFNNYYFILANKLSLDSDTVCLLLKNKIIRFNETSVHNRRSLLVCKTALEYDFNNFKYIPNELQKNTEILALYKSEFFRQSIKKFNIKNSNFYENNN